MFVFLLFLLNIFCYSNSQLSSLCSSVPPPAVRTTMFQFSHNFNLTHFLIFLLSISILFCFYFILLLVKTSMLLSFIVLTIDVHISSLMFFCLWLCLPIVVPSRPIAVFDWSVRAKHMRSFMPIGMCHGDA